MQHKADHFPYAPCCPPVHTALQPVSGFTPSWLYIISAGPAGRVLCLFFQMPPSSSVSPCETARKRFLKRCSSGRLRLGCTRVAGSLWINTVALQSTANNLSGEEMVALVYGCYVPSISGRVHGTYWRCRVHACLLSRLCTRVMLWIFQAVKWALECVCEWVWEWMSKWWTHFCLKMISRNVFPFFLLLYDILERQLTSFLQAAPALKGTICE